MVSSPAPTSPDIASISPSDNFPIDADVMSLTNTLVANHDHNEEQSHAITPPGVDVVNYTGFVSTSYFCPYTIKWCLSTEHAYDEISCNAHHWFLMYLNCVTVLSHKILAKKIDLSMLADFTLVLDDTTILTTINTVIASHLSYDDGWWSDLPSKYTLLTLWLSTSENRLPPFDIHL